MTGSRLYSVVTLGLLLVLPFPVMAADHIMTANTADQAPYSTPSNDGIYDRIVLSVFAELGIDIRINHLPSARSIENVNIGIDDFEYARITGLSKEYPNIIKVDEKLLDFQFTAFAHSPDIALSGWQDLENYHVGYIRGWKIYEKNVPQAKSITLVSDHEELFRLLKNDRIDIGLYELQRGRYFLNQAQITSIFPLENPLAIRAMYLYANTRHKDLVPAIEAEIARFKMKDSYLSLLNGHLPSQ